MTVTEIAKLAGVSIGTVDRVIHNRGRVAPVTKQKVQEIIDKYDYQPNLIARHLKRQTHYKIGVLLPELKSGYGYWETMYNSMIETAEKEFSAFSFSVEPYFFKRPAEESLRTQFNAMVESECDAYIIAPVMLSETLELLYSIKDIKPYCFVDSPLPDASPVVTIVQNPYKAGYLAGRLTEMAAGYKKGSYVVLESFNKAFNLSERARGFCDWFRQKSKSYKPICWLAKDFSNDGIRVDVKQILDSVEDLAGICTVSVEVQFVADEIIKANRKADVAVVGFDLVEGNYKALKEGGIDCLISQQPQEQGRIAVRQLFRTLIYEETVAPEIEIPAEIFFKENLI